MPINRLFLAMILIVAASNYLVQFPINEWLTLGAFTYPISYLITELSIRFHGPSKTKKIVYAGFGVAVFVSLWLATPRIALASGLAFLTSQLLDILIFSNLRKGSWWLGPLVASLSASLWDTIVFWVLAFYGENMPLVTLACGDFFAKFAIDLVMLIPFRLALRNGALKSAP